jgi:hypothetical protein
MVLKMRTTIGLILIIVVLTAAGCEPLRKKFVRQKKKDESNPQFLPVLDPVDYPANVQTPEESYRHHFSLWQVWDKELVMRIEEKASDKKINFTFNQVMVQLAELEKLLRDEKKTQMNQYITQLNDIQRDLGQPRGIRDNSSIQRKVQRIGSKLREGFRFNDVEQSLIR